MEIKRAMESLVRLSKRIEEDRKNMLWKNEDKKDDYETVTLYYKKIVPSYSGLVSLKLKGKSKPLLYTASSDELKRSYATYYAEEAVAGLLTGDPNVCICKEGTVFQRGQVLSYKIKTQLFLKETLGSFKVTSDRTVKSLLEELKDRGLKLRDVSLTPIKEEK